MEPPPPLITSSELRAWGYGDERRRRVVAEGMLLALRRGIHVTDDSWRSASSEERAVARAMALASASRVGVVSHESAAACHGFPLVGAGPDRVHVTLPPSRPGATSGTIRHRGELASEEIVELHGIRCTSLLRTVADVARTASREQAVTVADAVLRRLCGGGRDRYDHERAAQIRDEVLAIARRSAHGIGRAERVMRFADGRAERPGESISRIRLAELGFTTPRLQVAIPAQRPGRFYFSDFGLDRVRTFGEFDGRVKYEDAALASGRSIAQIIVEEKEREDWIRGTTGYRVVRWGWDDISSAAALGARLAAFGIHPA